VDHSHLAIVTTVRKTIFGIKWRSIVPGRPRYTAPVKRPQLLPCAGAVSLVFADAREAATKAARRRSVSTRRGLNRARSGLLSGRSAFRMLLWGVIHAY
jgi:hypothetical protein